MFSENIHGIVSKTFGLRSPKGDVGIEIETEGRNLPQGKVTGTFVGKEDGSLRNGMEYVSSPILAKDVTERVSNLAATLVEKGALLNPSYRSSTHIHVNYCDYTWKDVLGTMVAWTVLEPVVFRMMPPGRDGSLFCVSSYDSGDLTDYVDGLCTSIGQSFNAGFNARGKYSSLNLTRLSDLGTLEYRVFPTSVDAAQIQTWVDWTMNIRNFVQKQDDLSFLTMVREAEQDPRPFLSEIFGPLPMPPDVPHLVDYGARQGFELARVISRHLKAQPKKSQTKSKYGVNFIQPADIPQIREDVPAAPVPFPPGFAARRGNNGRGPAVPARRRAAVGAVGGGAAEQVVFPEDRQLRRLRMHQQAYAGLGQHDVVARYAQRIAERVALLQRQEQLREAEEAAFRVVEDEF